MRRLTATRRKHPSSLSVVSNKRYICDSFKNRYSEVIVDAISRHKKILIVVQKTELIARLFFTE